MADREKIIRKLQDALEDAEEDGKIYAEIRRPVLFDAIALLKEQEAVEPFHRCIGKNFSLVEDSHFDYCPYCGKPITWAKQEGR